MLVYDVPETDRRYRNVLRDFLKRLRMGLLQKSVWISARDIRPEYADLVRGISVHLFTRIFEARTVLGQSAQEIVRAAWDFDRLCAAQGFYFEVYSENLRRLDDAEVSSDFLLELAREELAAYLAVMSEDPLLPEDLWPRGYCGKSVWGLHQRFQKKIGQRLKP